MNNKVEPILTIILICNHHGKKAQSSKEDRKEGGKEDKEAPLVFILLNPFQEKRKIPPQAEFFFFCYSAS